MKLNLQYYWKTMLVLTLVLLIPVLVDAGNLVVDQITGKITDEDNEPLIGVNVVVKGTSQGTSTNMDGIYQLSDVEDDAVLVITYIGYATQEINVDGRSTINIVMLPGSQTLDQVVVTALGIDREKRSLGYSVGEVSGDEIDDVGNESVITSLSGKVAGVSITQASGIGSSSSVIIRGASSLGNNQPLYIIDGVPVTRGFGSNVREVGGVTVDYGNDIPVNANDIASISVLKGPSAAALYGSRAGNGVILITTKTPDKRDAIGVHFSTSDVIEIPNRFIDYHYKYANGDRPFLLDGSSAYWGGFPLDVGNKAIQWNSPVDENGNKIPTELKSYPDNMKNFLKTGFTSTNNLSISGAGDQSSYMISYTNMAHQGMIPNADLFKNSLLAKGTYDIVDNLTFSTNINFSRTNSNNRPNTVERDGNPLQQVYEWSHIDIRDLRDYWEPGKEGIQQVSPAPGESDNPYFLAYGINNAFNRDVLLGSVSLDWTISPSLSAVTNFSHSNLIENRESKIPWSFTEMSKGGYFLNDMNQRETNADFLVTHTSKMNEIDLRVSAGGNYMIQSGHSSNIGGRNLSVPGLYRISNIPVNNRVSGNYSYKKAIYSLYALASIGVSNQLYLDLTARNDWSSTLPVENRSYFYPSASLSWLANYTFDMPESISMLKLRGGVAQVGNDASPYQLEQSLGAGSWGNLVTATIPSTLLNPQLKPEISTSIEGGVDLNLFNDRLRFNMTYYNIENKNQILRINTAIASGYSSKLINAGKLVSKGWEIGMGGTPIANSTGWRLDLNANFSRNRVILAELAPGLEFYEQWGENGGGAYTFVGEEIGNMYSSGYAHVTDPNSPYYRWLIIGGIGSGWHGWQEIDGRDNDVKIGNFNPDFRLGLGFDLSYKRFSLNANFDWRQGGEFTSFTYRYGESDWKSQRQIDNLIPGGLYSPEELVALLKSDPEKYIIPQNGNYPRVGGHTKETGGFPLPGGHHDGVFVPGVWVDEEGNYHEWLGGPGTVYYPITNSYPWNYNQQVTFDASFIKLRSLSISYDIPDLFGVTQNARLSLFTRNIMVWNAAQIGIDPERAFQGNNGDFRRGIERQNVMPWTIPLGLKLDVDF